MTEQIDVVVIAAGQAGLAVSHELGAAGVAHAVLERERVGQSWLHAPQAFDAMGFPLHEDGSSTAVDGLHFAGVHFPRKRKSSLLVGVGEDAALVAEAIAERR